MITWAMSLSGFELLALVLLGVADVFLLAIVKEIRRQTKDRSDPPWKR